MQLSSLLFTTIIINLIVIKSSINAQVISNESCTDATCIIANVGIDIAVIIDASASLTTDQFDNIKSTLYEWAQSYSIGPSANQVQFAYVTYASWATSIGTFNSAGNITILASLIDEIALASRFSDRNIFNAMAKVIDNTFANDLNSGWRNPPVKHMVVYFSTDRFTGTNWTTTAQNVVNTYDLVLAIGVTKNSIINQFDQLASITTDASPNNVFLLSSPDNLKYLVPWLHTQTCILTNGTAMPTGGPTTTTTGFTTNTSSSSSSSTMFSTISPLIYPCERDIAIAIDMSTSMINTNNRQNELNYLFDALASNWTFSSDSVVATAFGYGIGFFDIAPKDNYEFDYATFIDIKSILQNYTSFQNASLTRVAQYYKDNYLTPGNYDGGPGVDKILVLFSSTADSTDIIGAKAILSNTTIVYKIVVIAIGNPMGDLSNIGDPPATVINADFGFSSAPTLTQQINAALCA